VVLRWVRSQDLAGRLGGDEFCIVLRGRGRAEAARFAERPISVASQQPVQLPSGQCLGYTMSMGHATHYAGHAGPRKRPLAGPPRGNSWRSRRDSNP
jgi:diguanylate cyclase (GGDEF)-like protein